MQGRHFLFTGCLEGRRARKLVRARLKSKARYQVTSNAITKKRRKHPGGGCHGVIIRYDLNAVACELDSLATPLLLRATIVKGPTVHTKTYIFPYFY